MSRRRAPVLPVIVAMVGVLATLGVGPMASTAQDVPVVEEPPIEAAASAVAAATRPAGPAYRFPVLTASPRYGRSHHDYPATDVAVACGTPLVAATDGVIWEVQRTDRYDSARDVPAYRGGRTVVIDGDDGVRYLYAHLSTVRSDLAVGQRVAAGDRLGAVGTTGRSTGCHLHFGISPRCSARVWDLLAGTIWPWPYFDAWAAGRVLSPASELRSWSKANPDACGGAVISRPEGIDVETEIVEPLPPTSPVTVPGA